MLVEEEEEEVVVVVVVVVAVAVAVAVVEEAVAVVEEAVVQRAFRADLDVVHAPAPARQDARGSVVRCTDTAE